MGVKILDHSGNAVVHGRQRLDTGVRLHYYTAGSGPALLLQHGVSLIAVDSCCILKTRADNDSIPRSQRPAITGEKSSLA